MTIKPGAYPWRNHENAWRPAHIHFSLFGANFLSRLVTQMYFPGDPLFELDPIFNGIRDRGPAAGWSRATPARRSPSGRWATASTSSCRRPHDPLREPDSVSAMLGQTPTQTVGPFFASPWSAAMSTSW